MRRQPHLRHRHCLLASDHPPPRADGSCGRARPSSHTSSTRYLQLPRRRRLRPAPKQAVHRQPQQTRHRQIASHLDVRFLPPAPAAPATKSARRRRHQRYGGSCLLVAFNGAPHLPTRPHLIEKMSEKVCSLRSAKRLWTTFSTVLGTIIHLPRYFDNCMDGARSVCVLRSRDDGGRHVTTADRI